MEHTVPHSTCRTEYGFTLIEILVALVILSFVALGIAGLFSHAIKTNASGQDYAELAVEARVALEAMQELPFRHVDDPDDPDDDEGLLDGTSSPKSWPSTNPGFDIAYTVDNYLVQNWQDAGGGSWPTSNDDDANLKRITITVTSNAQFLDGRRIFTVTSLKVRR